MTLLKIPYETAEEIGTYLKLDVPGKNLQIQCVPKEPKPIQNLAKAVNQAVEFPTKGEKFSELVKKCTKLTFIVENQFRAAPARFILPVLLKKVKQKDCDISIVIGCGKQPPLNPEELEKKLGKDLATGPISIVCNDVSRPEQYRDVGVTRAGTPLFVHEAVVNADLVVTISTTQATLWGYGGSGMIIPAVVGDETIELNHIMSLAPDCIPGNNNCRMQLDKYEALEAVGVQMGINVIVDNKNRVIFVNAGSPIHSHKAAIQYYNGIYEFSRPELRRKKADIAITGTTAPTNHLFFHTGWATVNCAPAVRDGGIIIQATPCLGYGGLPGFLQADLFKPYLPASKENQVRAIRDFYNRRNELAAGCVWYKIYEVMTKKEVWWVTDKVNLPFCKEVGLTAYESIEEAFAQAIKKCGNNAAVAFIPYGRYSVVKPS